MIAEKQNSQSASCGAPQLPKAKYPDAKHWAKVPRDVVLRLMAADQTLQNRLFYACLLWSECGPHRSEAVVIKDLNGFIVRDGKGDAMPARQKDLLKLLELPETMKGEVSRQIRALIDSGLLSSDGESLYLEASPPAYIPEPEVAGPRNWHIGRTVVGPRNLPEDPELRDRAIRWLDDTAAQYNQDRKELRARYRQLLDSATSEGLILIESSLSRKQQQQAVVVDPPPPPSESEQVREVLAEFDPTVSVQAANRLIKDCRQNAPVDAATIVAMVRIKAKSITGTTRSPIGFLLATVPTSLQSHQTANKPQPRAPDLCPRCSGTGLVGGIRWTTLAELAAITNRECCDCPDGRLARDMLEDTNGA